MSESLLCPSTSIILSRTNIKVICAESSCKNQIPLGAGEIEIIILTLN